MKQGFFIFSLLSFALLGCQPKTTSEQGADTLSVDTVASHETTKMTIGPSVAPTTFQMGDWSGEFDLLAFPNTQFHKEANGESEVIGEATTLTPLFIKSTTSQRSEDADICSRYFWYQVELPDQQLAWVYGADIKLPFSDEGSGASSLHRTSFSLMGKEYSAYLLTDAGIGPSDENGLTGCMKYLTLYFYNEPSNTIYLIKAFDSQLTHNPDLLLNCYPNYLGFTTSEGGQATPVSIRAEDSILHLGVNVAYQMGGGQATLNITYHENGFELTSFTFEGDGTLN